MLCFSQDDQKAPLKGVRTPGKQPGGLFSCEDGPAGPGMLARPQAVTEGCFVRRDALIYRQNEPAGVTPPALSWEAFG